MTQLKLNDFFQDIESSVLAPSDIEDTKNRPEEDPRTETNVSFHSFKLKKSLEKDDFNPNTNSGTLFLPHDSKGMYSRYSIVSGDRSNTFTAGMNSKGVKSMGKETVTRLGKYAQKDTPFTEFGRLLANEKQDNFSKFRDLGMPKSDQLRNLTQEQFQGVNQEQIKGFSSTD